MNTVTFGKHQSYDDLMLLLTEKRIGTPAPKIETVDIPGGDGVLDLTEFFGETKYKNRNLSFDFSTIVHKSLFMQVFTMVQNLLHGKKMDIYLSDDDWYYTGRVNVNEWKADKSVGKFTVDCDCEPYKHRLSAQSVNLCGENMLNLDTGTAVVGHESIWTKTETGYSFSRGSITGGSFLYFNIPVVKGKTYIFYADNMPTAQTLYVYTDRLYGTVAGNGNPCIFTAKSSGRYIFGLYCSSGVVNGTFNNVMVCEGSVKLPFVPYDASEKIVTAVFSNTRRPAVPTIYITGDMSAETPSNFVTLSPGANTLTEFTFYKGDNTLTFKGNGLSVVEWKEGSL